MNVIRSIIVLGVRGWNKSGRISFECKGGSRTALTGAVTMEQAGSTVGAGSLFSKTESVHSGTGIVPDANTGKRE